MSKKTDNHAVVPIWSVHPRGCDCCTNARATENVDGDQLCATCAAWVRQQKS